MGEVSKSKCVKGEMMKIEDFKTLLMSFNNDDRYPSMFAEIAFRRFVMAIHIHEYLPYEDVEKLEDAEEACIAIVTGLERMKEEFTERVHAMMTKVIQRGLEERNNPR